jgi:hypothetical protein
VVQYVWIAEITGMAFAQDKSHAAVLVKSKRNSFINDCRPSRNASQCRRFEVSKSSVSASIFPSSSVARSLAPIFFAVKEFCLLFYTL